MISSHLGQEVPGFDDIITPDDPDFKSSGLKLTSLVRIGRLAVVSHEIFIGSVGQIDDLRLSRIKQRLSKWIQAT
jgi:mRNA interferase MazF